MAERAARFLEKFKAGPSVNLELAEAALRRALAIDPQLASAHHFYAQLQIDLGHPCRESVAASSVQLPHDGSLRQVELIVARAVLDGAPQHVCLRSVRVLA